MGDSNILSGLMDELFMIERRYKKLSPRAIRAKLLLYLETCEDMLQVHDAFILMKLYSERDEKNSFFSSKMLAKPILDRLNRIGDWDFYDAWIFAYVVEYSKTYEQAMLLAKKAFSALALYTDDSRHSRVKLTLHFKIATRLLRLQTFETESLVYINEEKMNSIFHKHIQEAIDICEKEDLESAEILITKGLFDKDYDLVDKNMKIYAKKREAT